LKFLYGESSERLKERPISPLTAKDFSSYPIPMHSKHILEALRKTWNVSLLKIPAATKAMLSSNRNILIARCNLFFRNIIGRTTFFLHELQVCLGELKNSVELKSPPKESIPASNCTGKYLQNK